MPGLDNRKMTIEKSRDKDSYKTGAGSAKKRKTEEISKLENCAFKKAALDKISNSGKSKNDNLTGRNNFDSLQFALNQEKTVKKKEKKDKKTKLKLDIEPRTSSPKVETSKKSVISTNVIEEKTLETNVKGDKDKKRSKKKANISNIVKSESDKKDKIKSKTKAQKDKSSIDITITVSSSSKRKNKSSRDVNMKSTGGINHNSLGDLFSLSSLAKLDSGAELSGAEMSGVQVTGAEEQGDEWDVDHQVNNNEWWKQHSDGSGKKKRKRKKKSDKKSYCDVLG